VMSQYACRFELHPELVSAGMAVEVKG